MPRRKASENTPAGPSRSKGQSPQSTVVSVGSSLMLVLGVFFFAVWLWRRNAPKGSQNLPGEVVEVLGRAPLAGKQQMHLVRVGNKLVLLSVTPGGAETLTEITDPAEIDRIAGLCEQNRSESITASFRQVLGQINRDASVGRFDPEQGSEEDVASRRRSESSLRSGWEGIDA